MKKAFAKLVKGMTETYQEIDISKIPFEWGMTIVRNPCYIDYAPSKIHDEFVNSESGNAQLIGFLFDPFITVPLPIGGDPKSPMREIPREALASEACKFLDETTQMSEKWTGFGIGYKSESDPNCYLREYKDNTFVCKPNILTEYTPKFLEIPMVTKLFNEIARQKSQIQIEDATAGPVEGFSCGGAHEPAPYNLR